MTLQAQIAKQVRDLHFGDNPANPYMEGLLQGVTRAQATTQVYDLNTIAKLVFHVNYYIAGVADVLDGGDLVIRDKYSFDLPPIESDADWQTLLDKTWADAERFATLIEELPESRLWEPFYDQKYGSYFKNLEGIIEHTHYHMGQIALIKKIVNTKHK